MDNLDHILMLDEGVPFGRRYGFFYNKDGTVLALDYEDSIEYICKLSKKLKKGENITEKLNIRYENLEKIEHPDSHRITVNQELRSLIRGVNSKKEEKYRSTVSKLGLDEIHQIYWYDRFENTELNQKKYNEYTKIRDHILNICDKEHIDYEESDSEIIKNVIDTFQKYDSPKEEQTIFNQNEDISDCIDENLVISTFNEKEKQGLDVLKKVNYRNKKFRLTEYTSRFFDRPYKLVEAIENKHIANRNKTIKEWAEFLIALPKYCTIMNTLERCENAVQKLESRKELDNFHNNLDFMSDLDDLLKNENPDEEYYYHATSSGNIKSILENGLFLGSSNLDSTAIPGLTEDGVLSYSYGDGIFGHADGAVVIIRKPNNEEIIRKSTEDEKARCMPSARRFLSPMSMNQYVIDKKYIVGLVDKENTKIYNNKHNLLDNNTKTR